MEMFIYTGYSEIREGILVLTSQDWHEIAEEYGYGHLEHDDRHFIILHSSFDTQEFKDNYDEDDDIPSSLMEIWRAGAQPDKNLVTAICW